MHLDRRLLGWGIFFILLGVVPLAVRANAVDADLVGRWPTLWPLLLIGWGIGLVLRASPVGWVGGALVAVTFGLMGGGAIATGFSGVPISTGCGGGAATTPFQQQSGTFSANGRLDVELSCGTLDVASVDGTTWSVAGSDRDGRGPQVDRSGDNAVTLRTRDRGLQANPERAAWHVVVPRSNAIGLGVTMNAGESTLRLDGMSLDAVDLTVNAGSLVADLAKAASLPHDGLNATVNAGKADLSLPAFDGSANLSLNAGTLRVCVPTGTAVEVQWNGTIAANNLDVAGLVKSGSNTWRTPGFDAGTTHLGLDVSANAGSFNLELGGICGA